MLADGSTGLLAGHAIGGMLPLAEGVVLATVVSKLLDCRPTLPGSVCSWDPLEEMVNMHWAV